MDGVVNLYVRNHIRQTRVKINLISVTDFCSAYINMCLEGANQKWTAQNQSSALTSRRGPAITSCSLWYKLACTEFPFSKIKCVISSRALRENRQLRDCDVNREFLGKHVETPAVALTCTSQLSFVFFLEAYLMNEILGQEHYWVLELARWSVRRTKDFIDYSILVSFTLGHCIKIGSLAQDTSTHAGKSMRP